MRKNWFYNYYVYDVEDGKYDLIFQNEKIKEIVKFLGMPQSTISSSIRRNNTIKNKYKIIKQVKSKEVEVVIAYDMQDNERLVYMANNTREMSEYFKVPISTIQSAVYAKTLLGRRYLIEKELVEA